MGVAGLLVLAHVPTPPANTPLHVAWGRRNIHSTLSRFHSPEDLVLLILTQRHGSASSCAPFGGILHRLITKGCSLSFSRTGILRWFCSRGEQEKWWLSLRIFGCRSHSHLGLCACGFHTYFNGTCMSPCQLWPCMLSIVVCVCVFLCRC